MKRRTVIKRILSLLRDNDVVLVSGKGLSMDAFKFDDKRLFYFDKVGRAAAFGLGLAIANNKRIFILCEDVELIRNFSIMAQAAASGCSNLFYIVLGCTRYQDSGGQPSIFTDINAPKAVLFNLGLVVHEFSNYFSPRGSVKELANIFNGIRGPMAVLIKTNVGVDKPIEFDLGKMEMKERFVNFVQDLELGTSLFVP